MGTDWTDPQNIIAIATAIIAICAVCLSIKTMKEQQEHDQLSLRPIAKIRSINNSNKKLAISIENNGPGSLIIKSIIVNWDSNNNQNKHEDWETNKKPIPLFQGTKETVGLDRWEEIRHHIILSADLENYAISPGESFCLIDCSIDAAISSKEIDLIKSDLKKLKKIVLKYTDIYNYDRKQRWKKLLSFVNNWPKKEKEWEESLDLTNAEWIWK